MKKSISIVALLLVLAIGAIGGAAVADDGPVQTSPDAKGIPAPLGDYGDRPAPHFDGVITSTGDTPTGSSYMLIDHWGGNWADTEKDPGPDDDLLCWAAAASNMMEWAGWGFVSTFDDTDDIFQEYQDHWTDEGSLIGYGLVWWFDGTVIDDGDGWASVDVTGSGGFWDPPHAYATYSAEDWGSNTLQAIDTYLRNGMAVGLAIYDGGHAITCWGFNYDSNVDKSTDPHNYYKGVWVTDSDDNKGEWTPPDRLRYYEVAYHDGKWYMDNYGGGWFIDGVTGLAPFPGETRPVADAGASYIGSEGSPITFDAAASSDDDALQYRWDFDDDRVWDTAWSSNSTASFTWHDDYSGTVVLEVFDGRLRDVDTTTVTVNNVAPSITANGDTINENGTATVSGAIADPSNQDTFTVVIDWGEGSPDTYNYPAGSTSYSETHQYLDDNPTGTSSDNYPVDVTVTDDDTGSDTESDTVVVDNVAPVVTGIAMAQPNWQFILPTVHGLDFTGTFTDVGTQDTHTAVWDWGDSSTSTGIVSESGGSGTVAGSHTYSAPGDYTVTLTVTDDDTGSHPNTYMIHIADVAEALDITNDHIQNRPDSAFKGKADKRKAAIDNMFTGIDDMLADEEYNGMIQHLRSNIREKADGSVDGKANNDWIIDPAVQQEICHKVDDITAYLETLL